MISFTEFEIKEKIWIMNVVYYKFKIIILEDNGFYNNLLTRKLSYYVDEMAPDKNCDIEISSFTSYFDFLRNLKPDLDIAIVDYYLGQGITGTDAIKKLKKICPDCKIIIISQSQNLNSGLLPLINGADAFVYKDNRAFDNSCFIVEEMINDKIKDKQSNLFS